MTINDFLLIKSLASGGYGKVILSKKKNTKDFFAVKVLEKEKMKQKNCIDTVMNERKILNEVHTEFITRGVYTFTSKKYLYMVMEYMKGGDLSNLLSEVGCFEEDMARYYIATVVLALEQLHLGGVIHRDLKPENLLIDKVGHLKLTDFGLSETGVVYKNKIDFNLIEYDKSKLERVNSFADFDEPLTEPKERKISFGIGKNNNINSKS